ncbi:hypothetical protein [Embleya scabrispora]|uniref:hypothetical protein n=1 Tax=Embleya scabrispora TaxID=159449 RepID=UPI001319D956|nr:hypothetical protein [Embleya scabrispora]MYS87379.1 hypothetical protein [Streptomyces sp. SID5474]
MLVTLGVATGCTAMGGGQPSAGERNPLAAPPVAASALSVPPTFDGKRGWRNDVTNRAYALAPRAGFLLDVYAGSDEFGAQPESSASGAPGSAENAPAPVSTADPTAAKQKPNGTVLIARGADKGTVVWSSTPLRKLSIERAPQLRVINTDQGEFAVLVRFGVVPGSGLVRSRRLTVVDTFPVASSGNTVPPTQHLERETPGEFGGSGISIDDGGVLFLGDRVENPAEDYIEVGPATLWNPTTGASSTVPAGERRRSQVCEEDAVDGCTVRDVPVSTIGAGVLTAETPARPWGRFALVGGWSSSRIGPDGRTRGTLLGTLPGAMLVAWAGPDGQPTLYAVHDPASGAVLFSGRCSAPGGGDFDPQGLRSLFDAAPGGRYVVAGSLALDLSARTLTCLAGDHDHRGVELGAVGDDGIAFGSLLADGRVPREGEEATPAKEPALVRVAAGGIDPLPAGTAIPDRLTASGAGLFTLSVQSEEDPTASTAIAMYPAAPGSPTSAAPSR